MPLGILLLLVIGGIAGITLALHLLGLSEAARFDGEAEAARAWEREFPEDPARAVTLSQDQHAALIEAQSGGHGIVWPMGADSTARYLTGASIKSVRGGLRIRLPDFTAPTVRLKLNLDEAAAWPARMEDTP